MFLLEIPTQWPLELLLGEEWFGCVPGAQWVGLGVMRRCLETSTCLPLAATPYLVTLVGFFSRKCPE